MWREELAIMDATGRGFPGGDVIHVYQTPQGKNRKICEAFAAGCGGKIVAARTRSS